MEGFPENIIFLDVDGVLNNKYTTESTPDGFLGIQDSLVENLATIVKTTNASVVLTTTWKSDWEKFFAHCNPDGKYLDKKLSNKGIQIIDKVNDEPHGSFRRGTSVFNYLQEHPEIKHYVILDDCEFNYREYPEFETHFLQTKSDYGLTKKNVQQAIQILSKERTIEWNRD